MPHSPHHVERSNLLAATVGNVLSYYDFAVYGFLAAIIGKRFFPADALMAAGLISLLGLYRLPETAEIHFRNGP